MTDTHAERMCKALERIAEELETINNIGLIISTLYEEPIEVTGLVTVKED